MIPNYVWTAQIVAIARLDEEARDKIAAIVAEIMKDSYNAALLDVEKTVVNKFK